MASGSFEIDSYSWFRSLPLSNCVTAYPQGTMFAVGECAFMNPYTFYQYQSSVGFTDTSTLSNALISTNANSLMSTTANLQSNINYNRRQIVSSIPLMRWISAATIETFPFTYESTFLNLNSNVTSTILSTFIFPFISSGNFGTITSNIYPSCAPYSLFSTINVTTSTFTSTSISSISSNFISTLPSAVSSLFARSEVFDFVCTFSTTTYSNLNILFSNVWLGPALAYEIGSQSNDVIVDYQYSIYISTSFNSMTWLSSLGQFAYPNTVTEDGYDGANTTTRIGDRVYNEIHVKQHFRPDGSAQTQIIDSFVTNSNFYTTVFLQSSIGATGPGEIFVDIFAPGTNNYFFTLVPRN